MDRISMILDINNTELILQVLCLSTECILKISRESSLFSKYIRRFSNTWIAIFPQIFIKNNKKLRVAIPPTSGQICPISGSSDWLIWD